LLGSVQLDGTLQADTELLTSSCYFLDVQGEDGMSRVLDQSLPSLSSWLTLKSQQRNMSLWEAAGCTDVEEEELEGMLPLIVGDFVPRPPEELSEGNELWGEDEDSPLMDYPLNKTRISTGKTGPSCRGPSDSSSSFVYPTHRGIKGVPRGQTENGSSFVYLEHGRNGRGESVDKAGRREATSTTSIDLLQHGAVPRTRDSNEDHGQTSSSHSRPSSCYIGTNASEMLQLWQDRCREEEHLRRGEISQKFLDSLSEVAKKFAHLSSPSELPSVPGFRVLLLALADLQSSLKGLPPKITPAWDLAASLFHRAAFLLSNFGPLLLLAPKKEGLKMKDAVRTVALFAAMFCADGRTKVWRPTLHSLHLMAETICGRALAVEITGPVLRASVQALMTRLNSKTNEETHSAMLLCLRCLCERGGCSEVVDALSSPEVLKVCKSKPLQEMQMELMCQTIQAMNGRDPARERCSRVSPETTVRLAALLKGRLKQGGVGQTHAGMLFKALWAHAQANKNIDRKGLLKALEQPLRDFLENTGWREDG